MIQAKRFPWRLLAVVLLIALIGRGLLLLSNAVSFHSDEAVVALMARHILQGERPTFFYGQAYMGSLDAWLVAIGFSIMGQSVLSIRIVQSVLYLLVVAVGFGAAWRLSGRGGVALAAGLLLAVPSVNFALYTTATLGGYNETLLFGGLLIWLGYDVTHEQVASWWRWALLGLCAGAGWWTNGLIIAYALPVALLVLYRFVRPAGAATRRQLLPRMGLALMAFIVGSAPWWIFDFSNDHAALATFLTNSQTGQFAGIGIPYVPPLQRAMGWLFLGMPTALGLRFPWSPEYFLLPLGVLVLLIYVLVLLRLLRHNPLRPDARALLLGMPLLFAIIFVASSFGADPTGRYFIVLALPFAIMLGTLTTLELNGWRRFLPLVALALVIGYQGAGQFSAATHFPGFTTQFDPASHIPNDHDAELIQFLEANDLDTGYASYWVSFRLAFLSQERIQFSAALPYKANLSYNSADNRYRPYALTAQQAERVAFVTTRLPALDEWLVRLFAEQQLSYQQQDIGPFRIYFDFGPSRPIFEAFLSTL